MTDITELLARMGRPVRLGIIAASVLLLVGLVWARAGADQLDAFVMGTWVCAGVYTDTPRGSPGRTDRAVLPEPFDVFAAEIEDDVVYMQDYRPPRSGYEQTFGSARIVVQADGRFVTDGIEILGEQSRTGSWSRQDGMVVVRFDGDRSNNHAMRLQDDQRAGEVLTWRDPNYSPEFTEVLIDRNDGGFTARFSTPSDSFVWRCTKLSDDPLFAGY